MKQVYFERAIFLGWYCKLKDCKFCYMSTIKTNKKSLRTQESILAESLICKKLNWKIEFLSSGYKAYPLKKLLPLIKNIHKITKQKQWLNIGPLTENQIKKLKPYIKGYSGAVECINPKLRKKLCPSKSLQEIENTFELCDKHGLKKSITVIIGLGETIKDFKNLKYLVDKHKISRITFYALKPQKGTKFKKGPGREYYAKWVKKTRENFPNIEIIVGSSLNRLDEISLLLKSGADHITKFPSIKKFNSKHSKLISQQVKLANKKLKSNLNEISYINWEKEIGKLPFDDYLKNKINKKLQKYLEVMRKPKF